ncbi:MAG TPA: AtpZ/AtpI family protein [Vicinamibacterales bacterium]|nr:AtpZ/AtpI family protein [Vicinamibacterales bacterium]
MALSNRPAGEALRTLGAVSSVGIAFVLSIVIGTGLGYALDRWLDTSPWFFLFGFIVGVAAGVVSVVRVAMGTRRAPRP